MTKYYLGLDMGTSSLGWAVTDEKYRLLRMKGKDLWGSGYSVRQKQPQKEEVIEHLEEDCKEKRQE